MYEKRKGYLNGFIIGVMFVMFFSLISLIFSAILLPPGSLEYITSKPWFVSSCLIASITLDLPEPSLPSNVINRPPKGSERHYSGQACIPIQVGELQRSL